MVEPIYKMIDTTKRRITISYRVALFLVAAVVITIAVSTSDLIGSQIQDAALLNLAGKQRMWSQRIALLSHEIGNGPDSHQSLQMLETAIREMEDDHQRLVAGTEIRDSVGRNLRHLYYDPPLQLNAQVEQYLASARAILTQSANMSLPAQPSMLALQAQAHGRLLDSLEAAVSAYEKVVIDRFKFLHQLILVLTFFAIAMLSAIALFVFKPAIMFVEQAQKRLIELNQLKSDFLANMSHEIRTPMNGIFGMTELLLDSSLTVRQQHYARTLQNSADHLLGLINDILDFSKLEAGQMKLDPIRFNLLATIEDVLELLSARAREKNLELLMRYLPGTPRFMVADPGRIRQVLFNLIGNAIKFTDQGYVMVHAELIPQESARDTRQWLRLRIEDTGIGIPEDKISRLFEKFMQVESGSTRARQGTGLGLAISHNLIKLMGGDISVQSQPGKGTVFAWEIPLLEASDPQPALDRQSSLVEKRILLVDDLAPNRLLYKETLTTAGVECLVAENAEEAISILAYQHESGFPVDAVVTDYVMPVVDGARLTQLIKNDARFAEIPVIILTSAGEQGLVRQFDEAGASACLSKPTTRQQLFDTLTHVLEAANRGITHGIITSETSATLNARRLLTRERPLNGTHILLVEDNRVNLEITTEMLHQFGCDVTTAVNGREGIEAAAAHPFDLIFMDCQMPEMDGFEAARHIVSMKAAGSIAPVPIVALTANALKGDRERCLESGMDDYLSKPVRKANLEAILLKWLRSKLETRDAAVPEETPRPISAPTAPAGNNPADYGIDSAAFSAACDILGDKIDVILTYYLEDAQDYIDRIAEALARHDPNGAIVPAHTLKSSSRQLGVHALADLAERMESAARAHKNGKDAEDLTLLLPGMREALSKVRPFFQAAAAAA